MNVVRAVSRRVPSGRRLPHIIHSTGPWHSGVKCITTAAAENQHATTVESSGNGSRDTLLTLAIETSCDDTSVAVLEKQRGPNGAARLLFHKTFTADSRKYHGIHPHVATQSHSNNLALIVAKAIQALPEEPSSNGAANGSSSHRQRRLPDFVSVTRGPGMTSSLAAGLNTAKGLVVAWQVPLVGVHHMQAHALTPRMMAAMEKPWGAEEKKNAKGVAAARTQKSPQSKTSSKTTTTGPGDDRLQFPFLTLLASGGHTLLLRSNSLTTHRIVAQTESFAVGDALDKCARAILPKSYSNNNTFGALLEAFAFPAGGPGFKKTYRVPKTRQDEIETVAPARPGGQPGETYPWALRPPLAEMRDLRFEFGGLYDMVGKIVNDREASGELDDQERQVLAVETMRVIFEHLGSRLILALSSEKKHSDSGKKSDTIVKTLVVSGGVASNKFLRHILRKMLDVRGYKHIRIVAPPVKYCTDNAAMVAWAGMEMFEKGWTTELRVLPRRKWSLDPDFEGGILGGEDDYWLKNKIRWSEYKKLRRWGDE